MLRQISESDDGNFDTSGTDLKKNEKGEIGIVDSGFLSGDMSESNDDFINSDLNDSSLIKKKFTPIVSIDNRSRERIHQETEEIKNLTIEEETNVDSGYHDVDFINSVERLNINHDDSYLLDHKLNRNEKEHSESTFNRLKIYGGKQEPVAPWFYPNYDGDT